MDWTSFTKTINIKAAKSTIYKAFSTRKGMESWFLKRCEYKAEDGRIADPEEFVTKAYSYHFQWHGWDDSANEHGHIVQTNGKDLFEFTFNANGKTNMIVIVNILEEDDECIVSLKQYNIPLDEKSREEWYLGCLTGWTFYLANLKSILEGGIDLRNKNPKVLKHKVINS